MVDTVDIAIVGAGIAGAALAQALAPQPQRAAAGARSAARLPQHRRQRGDVHGKLRPAPGPGTDARQPRLLQRATGTAIERLDAATTLQRVPVLHAQGLAGALWEPGAMDIDVHALHQGFLRDARRKGATLLCSAELASAQREGRHWQLRLSDGRTVQAQRLVNAAGAWADHVTARCGSAPVGLQPCRRSAFTFDPPADTAFRDWPVTAGIDDRWYFKPDAGQLLGSPANADPVPAHDVQPEALDIATGIAAIEERTTLRIRRPRRSWAGLRSFVPDGELVIGFDTTGLFWLAGQGGYGIQSAAGAAQLAAALLLQQPLPDALRAQGVDPALMAPTRMR